MLEVPPSAAKSRQMSGVRVRHTRPELAVRSWLHRAGYRFRLHVKSLPGNPDIVLPRWRTVVLVHGCFWHQHPQCRKSRLPRTNERFWRRKLLKNRTRDVEIVSALKRLGWSVIVIWECETRTERQIARRLMALRRKAPKS